MLEVTITQRHAVTGEVRELGRMTITNDGSGDPLRGNYDVKLRERSISAKLDRSAHITGHPRVLPVWALVRKAIDMIL